MTWRVVRAVAGGTLIAGGIGVGAFNEWWAALAFGVPLIMTGVVLIPRTTRVSELPVFRRGTGASAVPVRIEALTRSTLAPPASGSAAPGPADDQPTMVTALLTPGDDTQYRARWITAMGTGHARDLVASPFTALPRDLLPERTTRTPEFDDRPGSRAYRPPLIALAAAAVVLFAVPAGVWAVDGGPSGGGGVLGPRFSDDRAARSDDEGTGVGEDASAMQADRYTETLEQVAAIAPEASDNLLSMTFDADGTTRAEVYHPESGESSSLYFSPSTGWQPIRRTETTKRRGDTFRAADATPNDLPALIDAMTGEARKAAPDAELIEVSVTRAARDQPVRWTAGFGPSIIADITIEALPDGTVAPMFDPADFDVSFAHARSALAQARLAADQPVLTRFEIRGTADATPIIFAGSIQSSGGVLLDFTAPGRNGNIIIVPGLFPKISERPTTSTSAGDFAFGDTSVEAFESIRQQAMDRGSVEPFDADAVDIMMWNTFRRDGIVVVLIAMADEPAASGTYTPQGAFIATGTR